MANRWDFGILFFPYLLSLLLLLLLLRARFYSGLRAIKEPNKLTPKIRTRRMRTLRAVRALQAPFRGLRRACPGTAGEPGSSGPEGGLC